MADEKELELDKPKSKKKLIIIIAIVVILLGGGAGAFFFLGSGDEPVPNTEMSAEAGEGEALEGEEVVMSGAETGSALYVSLPRPFRFNVPGAARDRFVEIRVQLLVRGGDNEENTKKHIPLLESTLLGIFTQENADDLATSVGKTALKQKALTEVQSVMKDLAGSATVEKVLFTGFVMQ